MITITLEFPHRVKLAGIASNFEGGSLADIWVLERLAEKILPSAMADEAEVRENIVNGARSFQWSESKSAAIPQEVELEDADAAALLHLMRTTKAFIPRYDAVWTRRVVAQLDRKA